VEIVDAIRLDRDQSPRPYDPDWGRRFFTALIQADRLLERFRGYGAGAVTLDRRSKGAI
jgi:hypothetical protein